MVVPRAELRAALARLLRLYASEVRPAMPAIDHAMSINA
jgi:hypothetical protein